MRSGRHRKWRNTVVMIPGGSSTNLTFEEILRAFGGGEGVAEVLVELDLGCTPEAAVSGAVVVQSEYSAFLTFNAMRLMPDDKYHPVVAALVEFPGCLITKFGYPNDEAWDQIPRTRGLAYGIYEVQNSEWKLELARLNRFAFPDTKDWRGRHFLFLFHDSSFECI